MICRDCVEVTSNKKRAIECFVEEFTSTWGDMSLLRR